MSILETVLQPDVASYKKLVIDAADADNDDIPDYEVLEGLGRTSSDFVDDVARRRVRAKALADLKRADELDKEAAKIRVPEPVNHGATKLTDIDTVGQLFEILETIRNPVTGGSAEKIQRADLQSEAAAIRGRAMESLADTSDPAITQEIRELKDQISGLEHSIAANAPIIAEAERLQVIHERIDACVRGKHHPLNSADVPLAAQRRTLEAEAKKYPADTIRRGKAARKASDKAASRITSLREKIKKASFRVRKLEHQRWSGD